MDTESEKLAEMLTKLAAERVLMLGGLMLDNRKRAKAEEAERVRLKTEAQAWSLPKCVAVVPWIDTGYPDEDGNADYPSVLDDNGRLAFHLAFVWLAPFPGEHIRVSFGCCVHTGLGRPPITYTVQDRKIAGTSKPGQLQGIMKVLFDLRPDRPVNAADLGPRNAATTARLGAEVTLERMTVTANGPWPQVTDSVDLPAIGFWVPRI